MNEMNEMFSILECRWILLGLIAHSYRKCETIQAQSFRTENVGCIFSGQYS